MRLDESECQNRKRREPKPVEAQKIMAKKPFKKE
jgi:hypothetical protein